MKKQNTLSKVTALLGLAAVAFALPAPAFAKSTTRVYPGQSIQAALDAASPGDEIRVEPGVYYEQVVIEKDGITLAGAGASESGTVLQPPATRQQTSCSEGTTFQDGICILGNPTVDNVTVQGFLIRGFPDGGVSAFFTSDLTVKEIWADGNFVGIFSQGAEGEMLEGNVVSNGVQGIFLWDSPAANASVTRNEAYGNLVGLLAENSSHGKISDNYAHDNCLGIAVTDGGGGGASDWKVTDNRANHNNRGCPPDSVFPGSPGVSGGGIGLQGATATIVKRNEVLANLPAFPNKFSGGIHVHSTTYAGGSDPIGDVIQNNHVRGNVPSDLKWDGSGSPTFKHNDCGTSSPSDLCD